MSNRRYTLASACLTLLASALITGCGIGTPAAPTPASLSGRAMGANLPVQSARVYLFAASTSNYGAASTPLLISTKPGVMTDAGDSNTYVTTDDNGYFDVSGDYTCTSSSDEVYLLIAGGNPGISAETDNSALALIAALGPCNHFNSATSTYSLDPSTFVNVNEVTTVAAVYALSQFMTDATHVGTSSTNLAGLTNAFNTAANFANTSTGLANGTLTVTGAGGVQETVAVPQNEINSLANALVPCVNSDGGSDSPCPTLFAAAGNASYTDTVQAMLSVARNPATTEHAIWQQTTSTPFFSPTLSDTTGEPADWSAAVTYSGGNGDGAGLTLDASGNLWSVSTNFTTGDETIVGLSNSGTPLTANTGLYDFGSLYYGGIAFDTNGNLWLSESDETGTGNSDVKELNATTGSVMQTISGSSSGLGSTSNDPNSLQIDGANDLWIQLTDFSSFTTNSVLQLSAHNSYAVASGFPSTADGFDDDYLGVLDLSDTYWAAGLNNPGISGITVDGTAAGSGRYQTGLGADGLAIDKFNNICFPSQDDSSNPFFYKMDTTGTIVNNYPVALPYQADTVAVDGYNNSWMSVAAAPPDATPNLTEVSSADAVAQSLGNNSNADNNAGALIDSSGNIWLLYYASGLPYLKELVGIAGPVMTPVSSQLQAGNVGQLP